MTEVPFGDLNWAWFKSRDEEWDYDVQAVRVDGWLVRSQHGVRVMPADEFEEEYERDEGR